MHINACTSLIHHLHARVSFLFCSGLFPLFLSFGNSIPGVPVLFQYLLRALTRVLSALGNKEWFAQAPEYSFTCTLSHRRLVVVFSLGGCHSQYSSFSCAVVRLRRMTFQNWTRA